VIIDIFSRYVPGWMLARAENAGLAKALITDTLAKQGIGRDQLSIHADRGSPMTAKPVALLLADLGVVRSHSRPRVCLFTGQCGGDQAVDSGSLWRTAA